jgi:hypothetical protein
MVFGLIESPPLSKEEMVSEEGAPGAFGPGQAQVFLDFEATEGAY